MNQCFGCNTCASADKPLEGFIRELPMETSHHRVCLLYTSDAADE